MSAYLLPNRRRPPMTWFGGLKVLAIAFLVLYCFSTSAEAHNREKTSEPANGEVLAVAPTQITFYFKTVVGKDSATAFLIEPSGARTPLKIIKSEQFEVIAALPPLVDAVYSVRWKLISTDGHPVTNKVTFTVATGVASAAATSVVPTSVVPTSVVPPSSEPLASLTTVASVAPSTVTEAVFDASETADPAIPTPGVDGQEELSGTPNWLRWLLRFGSYICIFVLVGLAASSQLVWPGVIAEPRLRHAMVSASVGVVVLALAQLAVLANDIGGVSMASIWKARSFDAGIGLAARVVLAVLALVVITFRGHLSSRLVLGLGLPLFATWALVGHSKSQRWPFVGVPVDVIHHAAAATWVVSIGLVGFVALKRVHGTELVDLVRRLSSTSMAAVVVLVVTGLIQSFRLVGNPTNLFTSGHGRLVAIKVLLVIAMLLFANVNRKRVARITHRAGEAQRVVEHFRRAIAAEFSIGLLVVATTASLVVRTPSISERADNPTSLSNHSTGVVL